ncbi:hypothetical protein HMPREF1139_0418 [Campylobacter sp. FOBRC14]|nr:hypothetical protein HMPREF1139_0418 [Campylobacter sp. FOBRC14]
MISGDLLPYFILKFLSSYHQNFKSIFLSCIRKLNYFKFTMPKFTKFAASRAIRKIPDIATTDI